MDNEPEWIMNRNRPKHLALHLIKLPLPGVVSILHRISGLVLFLLLPLLLLMLQYSLRSIETYTRLLEVLQNPVIKLILLGTGWAFFHHFLAGIRYLAIDLDLGVGLAPARATSRLVLITSLALTVMWGVWLW